MPSLRRPTSAPRISGPAGQPEILLESVSPYGSRRLTIECDGTVTAAYLHDDTGVIAATWVASHQPAPEALDLDRLYRGQVPLMPAAHTRRPGGRPALDPDTLRAVWLEEGDGVALLEDGEPAAVLPGWSRQAAGRPGYSRDVIGRTPLGWSLADAMPGLGPRIAAAQRFWAWQGDADAWARFQQGMLGHLFQRLGPGSRYWDVAGGQTPLVGVSERPAGRSRPFTVLSTVGMSSQRMPAVEQAGPGAAGQARIELALATTRPAAEAARIFLWLAQYPWREMTWLGSGMCIPWYHDAATFPLGGDGREAVLLLAAPDALPGPLVPDLSGYTFGGDPVRWLWLIPVTAAQRQLAVQRGAASLVNQLAAWRRSWVAS